MRLQQKYPRLMEIEWRLSENAFYSLLEIFQNHKVQAQIESIKYIIR